MYREKTKKQNFELFCHICIYDIILRKSPVSSWPAAAPTLQCPVGSRIGARSSQDSLMLPQHVQKQATLPSCSPPSLSPSTSPRGGTLTRSLGDSSANVCND